MIPYLNNEQSSLLKIALDGVLSMYSIKNEGIVLSGDKTDNELISIFVDATHIEGCSDKSSIIQFYYQKSWKCIQKLALINENTIQKLAIFD